MKSLLKEKKSDISEDLADKICDYLSPAMIHDEEYKSNYLYELVMSHAGGNIDEVTDYIKVYRPEILNREIFVRAFIEGKIKTFTTSNTRVKDLVKEIKAKLGLKNIRLSSGGVPLRLQDIVKNNATVDVDGKLRGGTHAEEIIDDMEDYITPGMISAGTYTDDQIRNAIETNTGESRDSLLEAVKVYRPEILIRPHTKLLNFLKSKTDSHLILDLTEDLDDKMRVIVDNRPKDMLLLVNFGGKRYTLSEQTLDNIMKLASGVEFNLDLGYTESDSEIVQLLQKETSVILEIYKPRHRNKRRDGQWFPYYHKLPIKLSKYGIYKDKYEAKKYCDVNCLLNAFKNAGHPINDLKSMVKNRKVPIKDLKAIANIKEIRICLTYINRNGKKMIRYYGKYEEKIKLGLVEGHYFLLDNETGITKYAMKHYEELKDESEWWLIRGKAKGGFVRLRNPNKKHNYMSSYNLIQYMYDRYKEDDKRFLEKITLDDLQSTIYHGKSDEIKDLQYGPRALKEFDCNFERKRKNENKNHVFFDCETCTTTTHFEYLVCSKFRGEDKVHSFKTGYDFLMSLPGDTTNVLIAHNVGYDSKFIDAHLVNQGSIIKKGNRLMFKKAQFWNPDLRKYVKIELKDSYSLIPHRLAMFGKLFGLKMDKEVMPYKLYDEHSIKKDTMPISEAEKYLKKKEFKKFMNNLKEWDLIVGKEFKHMEYSKIYCERDVKVLEEGYEKFRSDIKEITSKTGEMLANPIGETQEETPVDVNKIMIGKEFENQDKSQFGKWNGKYEPGYIYLSEEGVLTQIIRSKLPGGLRFINLRTLTPSEAKFVAKHSGLTYVSDNEDGHPVYTESETSLDIDNYPSISAIAHDFMRDAYKNCVEISDVAREFIHKTNVGGRVMGRDNEKWDINGVIQDFDAVSLYPSAMMRIAEEGGYLKGIPKIIPEEMTWDELKTKDGYFIMIDVKDVKIKRKFPLINKKDEKGIRRFSNDVRGEIYVDRFTLEDLIKYHGIEFDIIRGYYFDEGRDDMVKYLIKFLFEKRLEMKKAKNPIQSAYKLMMNSVYGKTILKPILFDEIVKDSKEEMLKYVGMNYNSIRTCTKMAGCDKYSIQKHKSIVEHYSMPQIGNEILSMSKRIMNEVICLAEDEGCGVYYQDTDSIHIKQKDVARLAKKFEKKHGRKLIGKGMGQFHCDFDDKVFEDGELMPHVELIGEGKVKNGKLMIKEDGKRKTYPLDYDVFSVRSIILGKKCYIDELRVIKDNKVYRKYHARMKGITTECIFLKAEELGVTVMDIYRGLFDGEEYEFDLAKVRAIFEYHKNNSISSKIEFVRRIKF